MEVLRNDPQNADALYYVAVVACQEGQFPQGVELARRASRSGRPQASVHNLLGKALDRLGEPLEAVKSFDRAIALDANFAEAHGNRANILRRCRHGRRGAEKLRPRARAQPELGDRLANRGATLYSLGRLDEAAASYDRAIALEPKSPVAYVNRAGVLIDLRRWQEALAACESAIAVAAKFPQAYAGRAAALKGLSRLDEALTSADRAISSSRT